MSERIVVVIAEPDPVARAVRDAWGDRPATGAFVDGAAIRRLAPGVVILPRPTLHIHDDDLDARCPASLVDASTTLVFPSVHRSEQGIACLTVHPLGNLGPTAEVGGRPASIVPAAPRLMTDALRRLHDRRIDGWPVTFEATHHGPALDHAAFFVEIGLAEGELPPAEAVEALATIIPDLAGDPEDRVAIGVGGGHYAPHFTDLAIRRRWAFGHLISRHALDGLTPELATEILRRTPECAGAVYARAQDLEARAGAVLRPRLREGSAPRRGLAPGDPRTG